MRRPLPADLDDQAYLQRFRERLADERVPYTGGLELTRRCNLRCVHCYVGDQQAVAGSRRGELTTEQWKGVIDHVTDAGCMELLFTGGEPLVRPDFTDIYAHAKRRGTVVTVFTNATLVAAPIVDVLADLPPHLVEVSIYGATAETHDRITQVPGSFTRALRGIELLLGRGIRVGLKTVLMRANQGEYRAMEDLAARYGATWRLDAALFPCLPSSDSRGLPNRCAAGAQALGRTGRAPLDLRVPPREAAELELSRADRRQVLGRTYARMKARPPTDRLYTCGAGLTGFHIDPYGYLQPCVLTTGYRRSLADGGFAEAWQEIGGIRDVKAPPGYECNACDKQSICSGCPAFFDLENGAPSVKSEYICALAQFRYSLLQEEQEPAGVRKA